ncbi:hypothetical protein HN51_008686 [Arachis hypogaea]
MHRSQDFIIRFLKGLDECFAMLWSQLLLFDPLLLVVRLQAATCVLDEPHILAAAIEGRHAS